MPLPPNTIARDIVAICLLKWMAGVPLDGRERAVVDAALAFNRGDQMLRCMEDRAS